MTNVLYLYGGWPGHEPEAVAEWALAEMDSLNMTVQPTRDPFVLERDLTGYDLIVIGWTQALTTEDLTDKQEQSLLHAVSQGTGVAGWHGMAASFRSSLAFSLVAGASFLEHPGGEAIKVKYPVSIVDPDHEITAGISDFVVATEQYYMHVDPTAHVVAETVFSGEHLPWLDGATMPVAFTHAWGAGRIFYEAVGHSLADLQAPEVTKLVRQGLRWAARS
jgi:type 1 glutamine amidotransferase